MFKKSKKKLVVNTTRFLSAEWWAGLGVLVALAGLVLLLKEQHVVPSSVIGSEGKAMCADFRNASEEIQKVEDSLVKNGILFQELGVDADQRTDLNIGYGRLGFPNDGIEVTFPETTNFVSISVETYAGPVQLSVLDREGNEQHSESILRRNASRSIRYAFEGMFKLRLLGGDSEAGISIVCFSAGD